MLNNCYPVSDLSPVGDIKPIFNCALFICPTPVESIFVGCRIVGIVFHLVLKMACCQFNRIHNKINFCIGHGWMDG